VALPPSGEGIAQTNCSNLQLSLIFTTYATGTISRVPRSQNPMILFNRCVLSSERP